MDKIYVFGHQNPDTDSITSAIALAYLKRDLGYKAEAYTLGEINPETKFVLDYFNVKTPKYLNDVKLQIKDINYLRNFYINEHASIEDTYKKIHLGATTGAPIVDDNLLLKGIVTAKTLLKFFLNTDNHHLNSSIDNIVKTLNAKVILRFDTEISGNIIEPAYRSTSFIEKVSLDNNHILIVGDRHSIIENAIKSHVKLIILTSDAMIKDEHLELAKINKVNIIRTSLDSLVTIRKIYFSNYVGDLIAGDRPYTVMDSDYYDDFILETSKLKYNNYPVVDKKGICKGLIRLTHLSNANKKKVILVDHNEHEQTAIGIDEAEILEIIDHHNIGNISTSMPINFRNMAVGSTNTIVYHLYKENRCEIPPIIAGLMLSGIISDTINFTSPTTTKIDKLVGSELAAIAGINSNDLAKLMFDASTSYDGKNKAQIITNDIKSFQTNDLNYSISQVLTMNYKKILNDIDEYLVELENLRRYRHDDFVILMITDIVNNCSYIFYTNGMEKDLEEAFNIDVAYQGFCLKGVVSRKKQVVPPIMEAVN